MRDLQKKMQHVENDLDNTLEKLAATNTKLDEKDKSFQLAEGEIQALQRKLVLLQDEHHRSETKLSQTTSELNSASNRTDEINRAIKVLETKNMIDEESKLNSAPLEHEKKHLLPLLTIFEITIFFIYLQGIDLLENQVKEAKQMVEESDIKYDEVARKLAMVEGDLQRADERADAGESKIVDLEEELRVIGENLKALEVAEEKAQQREEEYKRQIKNLSERLKTAESR